MNKDNLLFATIGLLLGFIGGYLAHEVLVARQPLRRPLAQLNAADAAEGVGGTGLGGPAPAASMPGSGGGPAAGGGIGPSDGGPGQPDGGPLAAATDAGGGPVAPFAGGAGGATGGMPGAGGAGGAPGAPGMAAIQQLREYVASHPKDADAVVKLANLNFDIRNWGRARDLYNQYLELRPNDADVRTDLGVCYRALHQYEDALAQFRKAEGIAPAHWKSVFNQVVVLAFDLKQFDAADKVFVHLQAVAPNDPDVARLGTELQRRRAAG